MQATIPKEAGDSDDMEDSDSDDPPSRLDVDEAEALGATSNSSDDNQSEAQKDDHPEHSDGLSLAEGSDNDDLIDLDDELPEGLIDYDGSDAEDASEDEEEWPGLGGGQKRKRADEKKNHGQRKKLRSLPTFASYEDYARMIDDGPEDDI
jgi:ribosome biogenesis protein MAK21